MHEGTYAMCAGPQYESGAEIKFLKTCGVDAMGSLTFHFFCKRNIFPYQNHILRHVNLS